MNSDQKLILVTGVSKGLGLQILKDLLKAGYKVAGCSRKKTDAVDELLAEHKDSFFYQTCTVGDELSEEHFFNESLKKFNESHFWGLINNAGVAGEGILATFPNIDSERILNINLIGPLRLSRLATRKMLSSKKGGRIINISSILGLRGYTGLTPYSASKAGLDGITRSLAREVGRRNITVNSINPGYMETEISASLGVNQKNQIIRRTPLGRLGELKDITPMIKLLLSDEGEFITGQSITIDGGITC